MRRSTIIVLFIAGVLLATSIQSFASCWVWHMCNGQSACDTSMMSADDCLEACLLGNWDWCEWDSDGDCVWDGQQYTCPRPELIFACGDCYGCCEWRDSHSSQDDCNNIMNPQECHDACIAGGYAKCRWTPFTSCMSGICDGDFARVFFCRTVSAEITSVPASGTLPFDTQFTITLSNNFTGQVRSMAGVIDVRLANGNWLLNWRAGFTNIGGSGVFTTGFSATMPSLGALVGENRFTLRAEDVTPAPYNQPPYPPAGDSDTATCTVTGVAP